MQRDIVEAVLQQGLRNLATSVPALAVYIVGMATALVTWRRASRASLAGRVGGDGGTRRYTYSRTYHHVSARRNNVSVPRTTSSQATDDVR